MLATPDVAEALAERIAVAITEFYGEDPKASPDFGRIINDRHFERLCKLLPVGTVPPEEPSSPLVQVASALQCRDYWARWRGGDGRQREQCGEADGRFEYGSR